MSAAWYLEQLDSAVSWQAGLHVSVVRRADRTVIDRLAYRGPLRVQRPLHPEGSGCPHLYILHPPGGLVSGDTLRLNTDVGTDASVLLTTPSSGKCYRARDNGTLQQQLNRFSVAAGGSLEYLPQDTIAFEGCDARLTTRVDLEGDARLCLWDLLCLGRPAAGEGFSAGRVDQHLDIWRDGRPLYIERNRFDGGDALLTARWGLGGCGVSGTWLATVMLERNELDALRDDLAGVPQVALTQRHGLLVGRYQGHSGEHARMTFMRLWQRLRPRINGRPPCAPRIWNT
ncbi:urease accessory protein UreD [Halopseudomonas nanhaiensis]|uniref:urease accessory protein UreD n=1 Tax=Halopseudomonas nanhaiensis TaxID=2830842 RepID=UPI001CC051CB|nr:urease accessory protein UreD [Halopseudomonas nanhaiensis]UAW96935.1 urease accessory protein UreD [Halopseudomonas nanhaiensis]